ncbi:MAG: glycine cleavage system aminomethyltransferase GcvT [Deltaproteobacteria bacterium]|nr:glycine cleavage system aminomethyltransferase GcvT [Deltaproteobacteria bacterium]
MKAAATPPVQRCKRTPLFRLHRSLGAKMVGFAGWEMPVQYRGVIEEHLAVRNQAGLFDVSHMGEVEVSGAGALHLCQMLTANDVSRLRIGQAQYNLLLNENGGTVDDIVVYRLETDRFLICVNAANTDKDFQWIREKSQGKADVQDTSSRYAQLALQGPLAEKVLQRLTSLSLAGIKPFHFSFGEVSGIRCLAARTGYTGEDGFELYCEPDRSEALWNSLMHAGSDAGLQAAGLGARDTLRLEKAFPLYGHELDDTTTPIEAGLEWVTKFSKDSFLGREALLKQKQEGAQRRLVGLELTEPGIARSDYPILKRGQPIGRVTSGTRSPTLGKSIALGYVGAQEAGVGNEVEVEIRGRRAGARIVPLPFYRREPTGKTSCHKEESDGVS